MDKKIIKIAFSGSRDIDRQSEPVVRRAIEQEVKKWTDKGCEVQVLVGDCPTGLDPMVADWASENLIHCTVFEADWSVGRSAGPIRNRRMIRSGGVAALVAFKKSGSKNAGTTNAISEAIKAEIPTTTHVI